MSRRRRLTLPEIDPAAPAGGAMPPLETKAMFPSYPDGVWRQPPPAPSRAPIAGVAAEASATAALAELAEALSAARAEGRLVQRLPLDAVEAGYLQRDRLEPGDGEEMAALMASLAARGQQVPVEVVDLGQGRFGLISGWRRLTALRRLAAGPGAAEAGRPATVLAVVRQPADAAAAWRAMVEENEIRAGLSFWERARVVVKAVESGVYRADRVALADLFAAVPAARRSKIGSFVRLVRALDGRLAFPAALSEKQGLALARALEADPDLADRLARSLAAAPPADAAAEALAIRRALAPPAPAVAPADPAPSREPKAAGPNDPAGDSGGDLVAASAPELLPGLCWREHGDGSVTLSGPALAALKERLRDWLARGNFT